MILFLAIRMEFGCSYDNRKIKALSHLRAALNIEHIKSPLKPG